MAESEDRLLRWLRRRLGEGALIGDDAAHLRPSAHQAVTVDSQISGIHFPPDLDAAVLARRLLAVNLSDLAAVGAVPRYAFLALSTPMGFPHRRFFTALLKSCRRYGVTLAGGDLARSPTAIVASLTLLGELEGKRPWPGRSHAEAGQHLFVGGTLGESALGAVLVERGARLARGRVSFPGDLKRLLAPDRGLSAAARRAVRRHLAPQPQLDLGRRLASSAGRRFAMMDVSDGLALDLRRLCHASGLGASVDDDALPFAQRFRDLCALLGLDPLRTALGGGEDYVLLFSWPPGTKPPDPGGHRIGTLTGSRHILLRREGGSEPLPEVGWDHFRQA